MVSAYTTNKRIEKPANNDDINTWDVPVNADWDIIDTALGGKTSFNVTGQSGTVVLAYADYRPAQFVFAGVMSAAVSYQVPSGIGGTWVVINNTTGAFSLNITNAGAGTSVTLAAGSTIVVSDGTNIRLAIPVASVSGGIAWSVITGNTTAVTASGYMANTAGGVFTLTLPAAPAVGDYVAVVDATGTFGTNALTIGRNALNIQGAAADLTCNVNGQSCVLVYEGVAAGWRVTAV